MGEMRFNSASGAYRWAVEAAERPGVMSSTEVVIRGMKEQLGGGGNMSKDDIHDTALSIIAACNQIDPIDARLAFKAALGPAQEEPDADMVSRLAHCVADERRSYSKCSRLARIVLLRARANEQHGQAIPRAWYAHALGIKRQSLAAWEPVIKEMEQVMEDWISQGKRKAKQILDEKGLTRRSESA